MKTTTADKIAFASVVAVALMTAVGWVYALAAERHAQHVIQTRYREPTSAFRVALLAAQSAEADDPQLARGR